MQSVSHNELKTIIKESVKEALEEELMKTRLLLFPDVSEKEMREIISQYGKPEKKSVYDEKIAI